MKRRRKTFKKADAILTADIELRAFQPQCRTDDHWAAQEKKIKWLRELQEKHDCPILDGGDLFDKRYKSNPSHQLLGWAIDNLPNNYFYTVPGNHDLPGKSIDNYDNSAMAVLEKTNKILVVNMANNNFKVSPYPPPFYIYGFPWGIDLKQPILSKKTNIALVHAMVYDEFEPFPGCEGYSAKEMMNLLPGFDLIVCGHNHQTFVREEKGRLLVNPGSLMRNDADQIDFEPSVFLWFAESNTVERVPVPIGKGVINRDYIDDKKKKENRMDAFVEKLGEQVELGIDFEKNLEKNISNEAVTKPVEDKIWKYYEGI